MKLNTNKGFTLLEVVISVTLFSFLLLVIVSFVFWMRSSNTKATVDAQVLQNARRIMDVISYEIRSAKSVYTPTTSGTQLSLETTKHLPSGEVTTYVDFFICGQSLCLKQESQSPIALTANDVIVSAVSFSQIATGTYPSVKVSLTVTAANQTTDLSTNASITLNSTVALRSY